GERVPLDEETHGFTLGGPIIKDRLFFFANYDRFERNGVSLSPVFMPDPAELSTIQSRLAEISALAGGNPDFGGISGGADRTTEEKRLLKLDWNINPDHRMTVRYSDTVGNQPSYGGLNATAFSGGAFLIGAPAIGRVTALSSNFSDLERVEEVWAAQVFSNWSPDLQTALAYSKVDASSGPIIPVVFPEVRIY